MLNERLNFLYKKLNEGFTLIEIMVALCILSFGILAVASMQTSAIRGNSSARDLTEATVLAHDKVEELITLQYNHAYLQDMSGDGDNGLADVGANADYQETQGKYTIYWNISQNSSINNTKTIRIILTWTENGKERNISIDYIKSLGGS